MNKPITQSEIETMQAASEAAPSKEAKKKHLRKALLIGLAAKVLLGGASYYAYDAFFGSRYVTTDNAYVGAEVAQVTPLIAGPVEEVLVRDTQYVNQGDVLVVLDSTDAQIALAEAEAAFGQTERRVRGYFANDKGLAAQVQARAAEQARAAADLATAQSNLERARIDLQRRKALASSGSVSGEELTTAENAMAKAEAAVAAARAVQNQAAASREAALGTMNANAALTRDTSVETNPEVVAARARVEKAQVELSRTVIRAPVSGVVTKRDVQIGERVQPGTPLMSVVPVQEAYVDANFKEGQLSEVREGQKVELTSDLYGSSVTFHGRVAGLSGGTGSSFALIPAQNATGNWIKVVQRVPVRILLDEAELKEHPLRVGLSMNASIDTKG